MREGVGEEQRLGGSERGIESGMKKDEGRGKGGRGT